MKIFHISDLHIGKQLYYYSLLEDQKAVLQEIISKLKEYHPDVLLVAGDIFDKAVPSAEAYMVLNDFLEKLSALPEKIPVLMIAGNHDSAERLNYAASFLEKNQIYIAAFPPETKEERLRKIVLNDEWGPVNFYLLPFTKPGNVRKNFDEGVVTGYDSAIAALLNREKIDWNTRNVILSHQFYVSGTQVPETCDSEQIYLSLGGIDSVDIAHLKQFDYAALGHIHGSQRIGEEFIRYSGTPLKYSVSESSHTKSITMVELGEKGEPVKVERIPLSHIRDVRQVRGTLNEVLDNGTEENCHDYLSVTLTDEEDVFRPKEKLEERYDHILQINLDNSRTRARLKAESGEVSDLDPFQAFREFYKEMQQVEMNGEEEKIMTEIIQQVKEAQDETTFH